MCMARAHETPARGGGADAASGLGSAGFDPADGPIVESEETVVEHLNRLVQSRHGVQRRFSVLEAGCGERCALDYSAAAQVTGVDISSALLERNPRLDHRIVSDLERAQLAEESFEMVVCWDVLEHLENPREALDNLTRALVPGGMLIVKVPNLNSVKGLATKYTPYRFHRWVYRRFAVSDGTQPFPTRFDGSIAPQALHEWAGRTGLVPHWTAFWEADLQRRLRGRLHVRGRAWSAVRWMVRRLSLGVVDAQATDFVLVLEKR